PPSARVLITWLAGALGIRHSVRAHAVLRACDRGTHDSALYSRWAWPGRGRSWLSAHLFWDTQVRRGGCSSGRSNLELLQHCLLRLSGVSAEQEVALPPPGLDVTLHRVRCDGRSTAGS